MFRRLTSGLPKDPVYPADLKGLGYFINDKDEIRMIGNSKAYFKYFLTKNERYNNVQREAMNGAIREIISNRLLKLGLCKTRLPLTASPSDPHVPIFVSSGLKSAKRIIILFYENNQDLGVLAHRIIGGKGGINEGSVINMVKHIQGRGSEDGDEAPGIIIANMGQLRWWRKGQKAVTQMTWFALPQKSAVDPPYRFDPIANTIPGNRTTDEHVEYIFNHVVKDLAGKDAKLDIIGVSEGAVKVAAFLEKDENFTRWGARVEAFAALGTYYHANEIENEAFGKWLKDRGRAYLTSQEPCGTFICGPEGGRRIAAHGCPVFSLGVPYYSEMLLPTGYKTIIDWFEEVAPDPHYANPELVRFDDEESEEEDWEEPGIPMEERIKEIHDEDDEFAPEPDQ